MTTITKVKKNGPVDHIDHGKKEPKNTSYLWIRRKMYKSGVKYYTYTAMQKAITHKEREKTSSFTADGTIPAKSYFMDAAFARGVWKSANEERQALLKSKPPTPRKTPFKLSPQNSEPESATMNLEPLGDLAMRPGTLNSRSPTPTPSRYSTSSWNRRSRSAGKVIISRKRSLSRESQGSSTPLKRRSWRSSTPSLPSRPRKHKRNRMSRSRSPPSSLKSRSRKSPVQATFRTAFLDSSKGAAASGPFDSSSRRKSITRTIVSVPVSPDCRVSRNVSRTRSRSRSRHGTPNPQTPKFVDGFRALASERDICALIQQRLFEAPKICVMNDVPAEVKETLSAKSNALSSEGRLHEGINEVLKEAECPKAEKVTSDQSLQKHQIAGSSRLPDCDGIGKIQNSTLQGEEHHKANGNSHHQQCPETASYSIRPIASEVYPPSICQNSASSSKIKTLRVKKRNGGQWADGGLGANFVPDKSQLTVS